MNIFILADLPQTAAVENTANIATAVHILQHHVDNAAAHCDKHVISQIKESVQMLVTVLPKHRGLSDIMRSHYRLPCKPLAAGHAKHPCVQWLEADLANFIYLARLAESLCYEKQHRWPANPRHEYHGWVFCLNNELSQLCRWAYHTGFPSNFAVAIKNANLRSIATEPEMALQQYRDYYVADKAAFAAWTGRSEPIWFLPSNCHTIIPD